MSRWATAKELCHWDWHREWHREWREICHGTMGEDQPLLVFELVEALDRAYLRNDRPAFLDLKHQLVNQPSWRGLRPTSAPSPAATSASSTAPPSKSDSPTLWDAIEGASSP
jgi:hypothetical protein